MDFEPLDANKFKNFFDIDQRLINEHEFRKSIFKGNPWWIYKSKDKN